MPIVKLFKEPPHKIKKKKKRKEPTINVTVGNWKLYTKRC